MPGSLRGTGNKGTYKTNKLPALPELIFFRRKIEKKHTIKIQSLTNARKEKRRMRKRVVVSVAKASGQASLGR